MNLQGYDTTGRKSIVHLTPGPAVPPATTTSPGELIGVPENPTSGPRRGLFWSNNSGIGGRFASESVVGFFRNPWSVNVGIRRKNGKRLNTHWDEDELTIQEFDFRRKGKDLGMFTDKQLIDTLNILRRLGGRIDSAILDLIGPNRLVTYVRGQFESTYVNPGRLMTEDQKTRRLNHFAKILFGITISENEGK